MDINKKLEELGVDKGQLIIFSVIGLVVIFLLYGMLRSKSSDTKTVNQNIQMPENKAADQYQTKLDAYARENEPKINEQSLNFDRDLLGDDVAKTKKQALEEKIDSMLASKSFTKEKKKSKTRQGSRTSTRTSTRTNNTRDTARRERERKREQKELEELAKEEREEKEEKLALEREKEIARLQEFFTNKSTDNSTKKDNSKSSTNLKTDKNIEVMVNGDQTLKKGNRINLVLSKKSVINGIVYPRNTKIYGFVKFGEHRVFIRISNINKNSVDLNVYDAQDGDLGLYTKVNLTGEVVNEVADDNVDELEVGSVKVGSTIKKIFKKKNKEQKIEIFNRTKLVLN